MNQTRPRSSMSKLVGFTSSGSLAQSVISSPGATSNSSPTVGGDTLQAVTAKTAAKATQRRWGIDSILPSARLVAALPNEN